MYIFLIAPNNTKSTCFRHVLYMWISRRYTLLFSLGSFSQFIRQLFLELILKCNNRFVILHSCSHSRCTHFNKRFCSMQHQQYQHTKREIRAKNALLSFPLLIQGCHMSQIVKNYLLSKNVTSKCIILNTEMSKQNS